MSSRIVTRLIAPAVAAVALSLPLSPSASAADVVMNLGWAAPMDSDYGTLATRFKELAEEYTNGEVEVRLHCCTKISSEDDAFKAMQLGTVDGYFISQNNVSPHWPLMDVFVLPYIFQSADHVINVTRGPVGEEIREMLLADTGVHLLTFGGASYRDFFNSRQPVNSMADMEGLKIRVPKNNVMLDTFRAFGAEPVPLAWSDTPTALQTRTVDGGDNGTWVIKSLKFYEFAKHLVILDHFAGVGPVFASDRFMKKLSDTQRAAVLKAADEAGIYQAEITARNTSEIRTWLVEKGGMAMTVPDKAPFIEAAMAVQDKYAQEGGPKFRSLLEKIRAAAE